MKGIAESLQRIFMSVAFAEAGELDTAREFLRDKTKEQKRQIQSPRRIIRASGPGLK